MSEYYLKQLPHMLDANKLKKIDKDELYYIMKKVKSDFMYNLCTIREKLVEMGENPDDINGYDMKNNMKECIDEMS